MLTQGRLCFRAFARALEESQMDTKKSVRLLQEMCGERMSMSPVHVIASGLGHCVEKFLIHLEKRYAEIDPLLEEAIVSSKKPSIYAGLNNA